LATDKGGVKRLLTKNLPGPSASVFRLIKLSGTDRLVSACWATSSQNILMFTSAGKGIRFDCNKVRTTGLSAGNVQGIRMSDKDDQMITCLTGSENTEICLVSQNGKAKRTAVSQFPLQGRGGSGVQACKLDTGQRLSGAVQAIFDTEIVIVTSKKKSQALKVADVPLLGRSAAGSHILDLRDKEKVTRVILCQQSLQTQTNKPTEKKHNTKNNKPSSTKNKSNTPKNTVGHDKGANKSSKDLNNKQIPLFKVPKQ
ncbi:MAG: DNA gyrase C-terminal beta-propeller domain-containing protein, partial [Anaerolineales bacterium]|nr:DNA gyrase C-terminal beta-propeller domain-containing protein [Anaerolineales bacterium]